MKKIFCFLTLLAFFLCLTDFSVYAADEIRLDSLTDEVSDSLFSSMEADVKDALQKIGISDLDFSKIYNLSFRDVLSYFTPAIKDKAVSVLKSFTGLFLLILLFSVMNTVIQGDGYDKTYSLFMTATVAVLVLPVLRSIIIPAVSVMKISNGFIISYIPVLTLILSFSGSGMSAMLFNTSVVGMCEIMSFLVNGILVDFTGCFICLVTAFSMNENLNAGRIISSVNKLFTLVVASAGTLFSGVLTVKNVMAVSVDSLSVKGIRFLLSSFVPVIGSSISEAYSSLLGSINLIKGSVAVIGILAVAVINVPVIVEIFLYYLSFSALSYFSEISCPGNTANIFRMCAAVARAFMVLVIFEMFILVISTGLVLTIKNT